MCRSQPQTCCVLLCSQHRGACRIIIIVVVVVVVIVIVIIALSAVSHLHKLQSRQQEPRLLVPSWCHPQFGTVFWLNRP